MTEGDASVDGARIFFKRDYEEAGLRFVAGAENLLFGDNSSSPSRKGSHKICVR